MLNTEEKCIEYIHSLSKFGKKAGLSNTLKILERLGNPHKNLKFIHIAGTNGKGSTSNMINNILISHNYKVGYYTSPYIEFFNERICINNSMISSDDLVEYTNRVSKVLDGITPIEFEFITAMAMLYFYEKNFTRYCVRCRALRRREYRVLQCLQMFSGCPHRGRSSPRQAARRYR